MRSILRGMCALIAALCAFCGVVVASATANEFHVEGKAVPSAVAGTLTGGPSVLRGEPFGGGTEFDIKSQKSTGTFSLESGGLAKATIDLEGNALYEVRGEGDILIPGCRISTIII